MAPTERVEPTRRDVLRRGLVAALGSSVALSALDRAVAAAAPAAPRRSSTPPAPSYAATAVSMVGDSLTVGTRRYQIEAFAAAGWRTATVDAFNSRSIHRKERADANTGLTAVDAIRKQHGDTDTWVVALGTNDCVNNRSADYEDIIVDMLGRIGADHRVLWVNVYLPSAKADVAAWNDALLHCADAWQGEMAVYDWAGLAGDHPEWLTRDRIHYDDDGYRFRAEVIAHASTTSFGNGRGDLLATDLTTVTSRSTSRP